MNRIAWDRAWKKASEHLCRERKRTWKAWFAGKGGKRLCLLRKNEGKKKARNAIHPLHEKGGHPRVHKKKKLSGQPLNPRQASRSRKNLPEEKKENGVFTALKEGKKPGQDALSLQSANKKKKRLRHHGGKKKKKRGGDFVSSPRSHRTGPRAF